MDSRELIAFVGCYTTADRSGHGKGITGYRVHLDSGVWQPLGLLAEIANPSYLALHPARGVLYSVHGGEMSDVSGFAIDGAGQLQHQGTWPSGGVNPVHLDVHPSTRWMVVANYTGATIATLAIHPDGQLGSLSDLVKLSGPGGPDPVQQGSPHPHDIPFDPTGSFVVVPDKGLDRVFAFRFDAEGGRFVPASPPFAESAPGAGPRHVAFHPRQRWAYVVNELNSTITAYGFEDGGSGLAELQNLSSVPDDVLMPNTGSEILVHPSGRFVFVSNRGHDSVGVFAIEQSDGSLRGTGWYPSGGKTPRAMALDPLGTYLYAANQASDTIVAFSVDDKTGALAATGQVIPSGSPSSIAFLDRR
jgi:6-phosphogluconolactonase (cycloisomerase 2 family)